MDNPKTESGEVRIRGMGASPGVVMGRAVLLANPCASIELRLIDGSEVETEQQRFERALDATFSQLRDMREEMAVNGRPEHLFILESQLEILRDRMFVEGVKTKIENDLINAEGAIDLTMAEIRKIFFSLKDRYIKQRVQDVEDVVGRLVRTMLGCRQGLPLLDMKDRVLVSLDLTPSETTRLQDAGVLALVTEHGSLTSHTAILARDYEIPAVVGAQGIMAAVDPDDMLVVDGTSGSIVLRPSEATIGHYTATRREYRRRYQELERLRELPAVTIDGTMVNLDANIDFPMEIASLRDHGCASVGLFRTEFLFMDDHLPDEDRQYEIYRTMAAAIAPGAFTVRTFDLGGDKLCRHVGLRSEANPVMGLRAIRLGLRQEHILAAQLRAILRAGAHGRLRILLPMVTSPDEVERVRVMIRQESAALRREGKETPEQVPLGVMIETPAAALGCDSLPADFFSIGTNDLIQFTLAIDRGNDAVAYLYDPLHRAVLRLLQEVVASAENMGVPLSMCGEMAGYPLYTPLLLGMGFRSLSMGITALPLVKQVIRAITMDQARAVAAKVLACPDPCKCRRYLEEVVIKLGCGGAQD
ncbi:phosphoenolpyruvate--protein phosphotransferase [bacterium]|nr:phosphoenolpyruvate--protein phosphotransferase [candidate division CSSED10-310 bacterium]